MRKPSDLSIGQIRARYLAGDGPVTPQLVAKLRRDRRAGVRQIARQLERRLEREREEAQRLDALLNFERVLWRSGIERIAGVDEAGMGPLAGPVVAAAVVFPPGAELPGVDDSKRLDAEVREELAAAIREAASGVGVGVVEVAEIDRLNIYQAGLLAMRRAVEALPVAPEHLLVDAREIPEIAIPQNPFEKGDGINFSIAAASIVAKTHRDALMVELDRRFPGYGFARHKGYGTREHQEAIRGLGPCPAHRRSFAFIEELCGAFSDLFYDLRERLWAAETADELRRLEAEWSRCREEMAEPEQRKLRLTISRRWKMVR